MTVVVVDEDAVSPLVATTAFTSATTLIPLPDRRIVRRTVFFTRRSFPPITPRRLTDTP
ncbi:MAG TPA: hypothetical protein VNQ77_12290 [Frankiaceae bacterium]|nr:hypothetical protein [Frankiaceae bacterium]